MTNTIQHKGRTITVSMENIPDGHFYSILEDGVVHKWIIAYPRPDTRKKIIKVDYVHQVRTISDALIIEYGLETYEETNYDYFYNLQVQGKQGEILLWNVLNGLLYRHLQVRPFKTSGQFYQPPVYDVAVTPATYKMDADGKPVYENSAFVLENNKRVVITTYEGLAPFSFSMDGGATWKTQSLFENLSAEANTLLVRDSQGNINPRAV